MGHAALENLEVASQGAWGKLSEQQEDQAAVEFLLWRRKCVSFLSPWSQGKVLELGQGPGGRKRPGQGDGGSTERRRILQS